MTLRKSCWINTPAQGFRPFNYEESTNEINNRSTDAKDERSMETEVTV